MRPRPSIRRHLFLATLVALVVGAHATPSHGQQPATFPNRPVHIVPFGTGGGPIDSIARTYADKLQQRWGQPVIVEPRPGASGIIAADGVAKAAPDGYTVLFTLSLTHVNDALLHKKLPYDPVRDFAPLSQLATGGPMLVARADAPYSNLKEFVAYAKQKPGLTYGTWGNGSQAHLMGELLKQRAGLSIVHVPYKSEAGAFADLMGGVLDFAWANPASARVQSQAGKLKVIGITGSRRVSTMPDVPTFAQQGFAGFDIDSWIGVYAPAGTPPAILAQWTTALREITQMPDVRARLVSYGFEPLGNGPAEFRASVAADTARVADLIKAAGLEAE